MSSKPEVEELIRSYGDACKDDEKLQSLDTRTEEVIKSLHAGGRGLSIDSLKAITQCVRDWNNTTADVIIKYKESVCEGWIHNSQFSEHIRGYFENSSQNLSFLSELDNFVMAAANSHSLITRVVGQYYENHALVGLEKMKGISENLKNVKAYVVGGEDNSAVGFLKKVRDLQAGQNQLLAKVIEELKELEQLEEKTRAKTIMFVGIGVGLIILGAVAAAIFLPAVPLGAAVASEAESYVAGTVLVSLATTGAGEHWILPLLAEHTALQEKEVVFGSMQIGALAVIKEWGEIESHLHKVVGSIGSLLSDANQASYTGVDNAVNDMKNHLEKFKDNITDLLTESSTCAAEIKRTRDDVLMTMKSLPTKK